MNELNEESLKSVAGGGGPSDYLYKAIAIVDRSPLRVDPSFEGEIIEYIPINSILYVLEDSGAGLFVKIITKGEHHRITGYFLRQHLRKEE